MFRLFFQDLVDIATEEFFFSLNEVTWDIYYSTEPWSVSNNLRY